MDYFSDVLAPGEQVLAELGAPGPSAERAAGPERVWYQLAVTPTRVLLVRLIQSPSSGSYAPVARLAVGKEFVRIRRFPRTPHSQAHLEILGVGDPVTLVDIDDKSVFPFLEPFLAAWGGQVEGAGVIVERDRDPYDNVGEKLEAKKLIYVVAAFFVLFWLCCGCAGLGVLVRQVLMPLVE